MYVCIICTNVHKYKILSPFLLVVYIWFLGWPLHWTANNRLIPERLILLHPMVISCLVVLCLWVRPHENSLINMCIMLYCPSLVYAATSRKDDSNKSILPSVGLYRSFSFQYNWQTQLEEGMIYCDWTQSSMGRHGGIVWPQSIGTVTNQEAETQTRTRGCHHFQMPIPWLLPPTKCQLPKSLSFPKWHHQPGNKHGE